MVEQIWLDFMSHGKNGTYIKYNPVKKFKKYY